MKNPIAYVSTILAAIPGLSTLLGAIPLPADQKWLFTGLTTFVPPALVLMTMMFWNKIKCLRRLYLLILGLSGLLLTVVSLLVFYFLHASSVFVPSSTAQGYDPKPVLFPFWLSGEFETRVIKAGGPQAFVDEYGPDTAIEQINRMADSGSRKTWTIIILALVLTAFASFISITFSVFWFFFTDQDVKRNRRRNQS